MEAIQEQSTRKRIPQVLKRTKENNEVTQIDETAARLNTHEAVCAERYEGINSKMKTIEERLDNLEADIRDIKKTTNQGFVDLKDLIEKRNNSSHTALITTAGTVIVALIGFLGYLLMHGK